MGLKKGDVVTIDRGYTDYTKYASFCREGIYFVTRMRKNARFKVVSRRDVSKYPNISSDQTIKFTIFYSKKKCTYCLRRIRIKDPETGRNVSYHRIMQIAKNKFTARLIKKRQTRTTYDKIDGDLEMAICIGNSVAVMVAASLGPPSGVDEFSIANALDKTDLVKCVTKDLEVPAESEIVIEGRITRDLDREGPFVDLTETRDFERQEPVFVVDCITHRKDAMYQALIPGRLEHKTLMGMPKEPTIYDEVSKVVDCKNVYVTMGGGSWLHGVVQIRKKNPDDGKKAIEAAFNGHKSMKHVTIVDDDVDIYDPLAVEWAMATRFQGDKDMVVKPDQPGSSLDPSGKHEEGKKTLTTKIGYDATIPFDVDKKKYEVVKYKKVDMNDYLG